MQKYQYLIDPKIAKLTSNTDFIPFFSLGENLLLYSEESSHATIEIQFNVVKDIQYNRTDFQKFHFFFGIYDGDEVYYERPVGMGVRLKMLVANLLGKPKITVNKEYYKYIRFKANNVRPPGNHLVDILSINLLKELYMPLHCAAISSEQSGASLLVAPPDTGKTLTTLSALKSGYHFLAEDIAFVDEKSVYGNPYTSTFLHGYGVLSKGKRKSLSLLKNIPNKFELFQYYLRPSRTSISDLMKNVKTDESAIIKKIFILDRGKISSQKIDPQEALRRILTINRYEFSYYNNPFIFAYSYFNPSIDIAKFMRVEEKILNTIVNNNDCYLIRANQPEEYFELVRKEIER